MLINCSFHTASWCDYELHCDSSARVCVVAVFLDRNAMLGYDSFLCCGKCAAFEKPQMQPLTRRLCVGHYQLSVNPIYRTKRFGGRACLSILRKNAQLSYRLFIDSEACVCACDRCPMVSGRVVVSVVGN